MGEELEVSDPCSRYTTWSRLPSSTMRGREGEREGGREGGKEGRGGGEGRGRKKHGHLTTAPLH